MHLNYSQLCLLLCTQNERQFCCRKYIKILVTVPNLKNIREQCGTTVRPTSASLYYSPSWCSNYSAEDFLIAWCLLISPSHLINSHMHHYTVIQTLLLQ